MPYKSKAQHRLFRYLESKGKMPKGTASQWAHETTRLKELPEKKEKTAEDHQGFFSSALSGLKNFGNNIVHGVKNVGTGVRNDMYYNGAMDALKPLNLSPSTYNGIGDTIKSTLAAGGPESQQLISFLDGARSSNNPQQYVMANHQNLPQQFQPFLNQIKQEKTNQVLGNISKSLGVGVGALGTAGIGALRAFSAYQNPQQTVGQNTNYSRWGSPGIFRTVAMNQGLDQYGNKQQYR